MHAGRAGLHVQAGDPRGPVRAVVLARGAGEQRVEVGLAAVRDPGLDPVDDELVPVRHGPGAQRGRVRAAAGLGQAVRPEQVPAEQVREPALLLFLAAGRGQREAGERVHADAEPDGQPRGRQFLDHLQVRLVRLATAAEHLRVRQPEQAGAAERAENVPREPGLPLAGCRLRRHLRGGQVPGQGEQRGRRLVPGLPVDSWPAHAGTTTRSLVLLLSR